MIDLNPTPYLYKLPSNWLELFLTKEQLEEFYGWGEYVIITNYFVGDTHYILKLVRHEETPGIFNHEWQLEVGLEKEFDSKKENFIVTNGLSKSESFFFVEDAKDLYILWDDFVEMIKIFKTLNISIDTKDILAFALMEQEYVENFLSLALTGNLWAGITSKGYTKMKEQIISEGRKTSEITEEEIYARLLIEHKEVLILDTEEGREYPLTLDKLDQGLEIVKQKYNHIYQEFKDQTGDLDTGDVILQCALFGDIIYG